MKSIFKRLIYGTFSKFNKGRVLLKIYELTKDYLTKTGWTLSAVNDRCVDKNGNPIPWLPFCVIKILEERIQADFSVFEYGSGHSTLWLSERVGQVISVEHDQSWYSHIRSSLEAKSNVTYLSKNLSDGSYTDEILNHKNAFDLIIIDGRERVTCAKNALESLKADGVILWDNSQRDHYSEGFEFYKEKGFKRLELSGLGPVATRQTSSAFLYREHNCLGI